MVTFFALLAHKITSPILGNLLLRDPLAGADTVEFRFLEAGLEVLESLGQTDKRDAILARQPDEVWMQLCRAGLYQEQQPGHIQCEAEEEAAPRDTALQRALIRMQLQDQLVRGNVQSELIEYFGVDTVGMSRLNGAEADAHNREQLKAIIAQHGFPTAALVGEEAMHAVFLLIQHADAEPGWQKTQLPYIEAAVARGDLEGQDYAYLYDRIQVNAGLPQRYGTQFSKIDPQAKIIELAEVEDPEALNRRRRTVGMMPIETYKALVKSRFE